MLESQSRAVKTRMIVQFQKKPWSKKLANWIGAQGRVKLAKNAKTPLLVTPLPENPKPKTKSNFPQAQLEDVPNP